MLIYAINSFSSGKKQTSVGQLLCYPMSKRKQILDFKGFMFSWWNGEWRDWIISRARPQLLTVSMFFIWFFTRFWKSFPPRFSLPFADFKKTETTVLIAPSMFAIIWAQTWKEDSNEWITVSYIISHYVQFTPTCQSIRPVWPFTDLAYWNIWNAEELLLSTPLT